MSIDGIGRPQTPVTGASTDVAATAASAGARLIEGAQLDALHATLLDHREATHPAQALAAPEAPSAQASQAAATSLSALDRDQVSVDIYAFLALFQQMAQSMRDSSRLSRATLLQAEVTALQSAADRMQEAAALRFAGAVTQSALQLAGGLVQVGAAAVSMGKTIEGAGQAREAKLLSEEADALKADMAQPGADVEALRTMSESFKASAADTSSLATGNSAQAGFYTALSQASGGIAGGLGGIINSGFSYGASMADADKARLDVQAKLAQGGQQLHSDNMQKMMDIIRDVREKLQSVQQAAIEANRGIARNI